MAVQFAIRLDDRAVSRLFARAPEATQMRLRKLLEGAAVDIQREMMIAANVGVTGDLRRGIHYRVSPFRLEAVIEPSVNYAEDVEKGTRPHYVSVAPGSSLAAWARQKGINKYAIQNSIARKGTKPHPFVGPTYTKVRPKVIRDISAGIASLIGELNSGR